MRAARTTAKVLLDPVSANGLAHSLCQRRNRHASPHQRQSVHALSEAVKEALHLQGILECIGETKRATSLSNSQSCLALVSKDDGSYKLKHFAIRLAFLKDTVKCSEHKVHLKFVSSADNMADVFTKIMGRLD